MFTVEQTYDLATLTALCRASRKTVRRVWRVFRVVFWVILAAGTLLFAAMLALQLYEPDDIVMPISLAVLLLLMIFEDKLNAWVTQRRMLPGTAHSTTVFADDVYTVTTDTTETKYQYENITSLCETDRYFIFFLGKRHGQVFDKQGFRQGDPDAFRVWLGQKTGKTVQTIQ